SGAPAPRGIPMKTAKASRVEYMGRKAVLFANDEVQALVETVGGMMPEFGLRRGRGVLNAHWLPDFRDNSGAPFTADRHGAYWKAKLLYLIAGDFPCSPSFGRSEERRVGEGSCTR